ncbi:MAG: SDR family oxidoreductase [Pseudomonadota bacterium]
MTSSSTRTAVVTGGSRGICAAIEARLAADGFSTVVNYAGSRERAEAVVADIRAAGGTAIAVQADVSDPHSVSGLFDAAEAAFGPVEVLVNSAGIMKLAPFAQSEDAVFDALIAVNLKGTFNTLREAARRMPDGGAIVTLSASVVELNLETYGVYAATKAAVETMTAILAKEMRGRAITVNAVAPGPTATEPFLEGKPQGVIDRMAKAPPLERLATAHDIANVVAFLAGPDGRWINGQTVRANGGIV